MASLEQELQPLLDNAAECIKRFCPDGEYLPPELWCEVWHSVCAPLELIVRAELRKRGYKIEKWIFLED